MYICTHQLFPHRHYAHGNSQHAFTHTCFSVPLFSSYHHHPLVILSSPPPSRTHFSRRHHCTYTHIHIYTYTCVCTHLLHTPLPSPLLLTLALATRTFEHTLSPDFLLLFSSTVDSCTIPRIEFWEWHKHNSGSTLLSLLLPAALHLPAALSHICYIVAAAAVAAFLLWVSSLGLNPKDGSHMLTAAGSSLLCTLLLLLLLLL